MKKLFQGYLFYTGNKINYIRRQPAEAVQVFQLMKTQYKTLTLNYRELNVTTELKTISSAVIREYLYTLPSRNPP